MEPHTGNEDTSDKRGPKMMRLYTVLHNIHEYGYQRILLVLGFAEDGEDGVTRRRKGKKTCYGVHQSTRRKTPKAAAIELAIY